MAHLDDEHLALLALGDEQPEVLAREHLAGCARCAAELESLSRVVRVGRSSRDVEIVEPSPEVWRRIHAELSLAPQLAELPRRPVQESPAPDTTVTRRRPERRSRTGVWWAVAAAALVIGVVGGVVGNALATQPASARLVAEARLDPLPDWSASGSAKVEESATGARRVVVDMNAPGDGLREVWLIDPATSGLVSLGLLSGGKGEFSLPSTVDLSRYSVVDVSQEPDDGNPEHSGDSIVRGELGSA